MKASAGTAAAGRRPTVPAARTVAKAVAKPSEASQEISPGAGFAGQGTAGLGGARIAARSDRASQARGAEAGGRQAVSAQGQRGAQTRTEAGRRAQVTEAAKPKTPTARPAVETAVDPKRVAKPVTVVTPGAGGGCDTRRPQAREGPSRARPNRSGPNRARPNRASPKRQLPRRPLSLTRRVRPCPSRPCRPRHPWPSPSRRLSCTMRPMPPINRPMPMPRPMAKEEVFIEGDHVVYPTHGVGKVERIAIEEIAGHKLELIHITFEENRMTLRVPVAKARTAGLRKLATRKLFDEALAVLKGRARIKRTMWSRRAQEYEAKINSGDPLSIAEVVRDLHRNAGQPDQSFSERQIYEAAMDRLAAELAALDQTDKVTAATKLTDFLKTV